MGPAAGPPGPPPSPEGPEPAGDTVEAIRQMIDMGMSYLDSEDDEQEKLQMSKILQMLQDFLAREQKEADEAMQGKMSPRLLRNAYGGAA